MKVYVLYDDPMEDETIIYGVFTDRDSAVKEATKLSSEKWHDDGSHWDYCYNIKECEVRGMP